MIEIEKLAEKLDIGISELKKELETKVSSFAGLITTTTAAELIAREKGLAGFQNHVKLSKFGDAKDGEQFSCICRVERVYETRQFHRKDGSNGLIASAKVTQESWKANLLFWDDNVKTLNELERGDEIKIVNATVKSLDALEFHCNSQTVLELVKRQDHKTIKEAISTGNHFDMDLELTIVEVGAKKAFENARGNGEFLNAIASDGFEQIKVVFWNSKASDAQAFGIGDKIKIEGGRLNKTQELELHANSSTRVKVEKKAST